MSRQQQAGCAAFSVIMALGIGLGIALSMFPFESSDALSFSGALVGSALTVVGAVLLMHIQRDEAADQARDVLRELVEDVLNHCTKLEGSKAIDGFDFPTVALGNTDLLKEAITKAQDARQWFQPQTAAMIRAFNHIGQMSVDKDNIAREVRPAAFYPEAKPDIARHLLTVKVRAKAALSELA